MASVRRHAFARDHAVLARILDPGVDLAVWVRRAPAAAKRFVRLCPAPLLPNLTFTTRPGVVRAAVRNAIHPSRKKEGAPFADDVALLAHLFHLVTGSENLRVRIERVEHDGCRLFHVDHVRVRLVCTYRGPGTEWLPEAACDRAGLKKGSNDAIVRDPRAVRRLTPYAVAVQKGEQFAGEPDTGLVHRSPPVRFGSDVRLVVVIDDADTSYR